MIKTARRESASITSARVRQWSFQVTPQKYGFCPVETWAPLVNLYQLDDRIEVCVDLSGVDPKKIDVEIEPGRLTVTGERNTPEPAREAGESMRIVVMEIDHGQFCRSIPLPDQVDIRRAESEYKAGLLWVRLPLRGRR